jgi:hypothetical protein
MTTDLLWIIGGEPDAPGREEFRYSLRSFTANPPVEYRSVWVVGDVPDWLSDDARKLPLAPKPIKYENQRASLTAYVNHPDAAPTFLLLNDDFFAKRLVAELPIYHRGHHSSWSAPHKQAVKREHGHPRDCWQCCVVDTADWVAEQAGVDPWIYENHTPLIFSTARMRDALNAYPAGRRLAIAQLYPLAGAGGEGVHGGNAKCKNPDSFAHKLALPMPYLSCSPESWRGPVGAWARQQWPDASKWERE